MAAYIARRLFYALLTLFGVTIVAFGLLNLQPGDPAELLLGPYATEEAIEILHKELRLDDLSGLDIWAFWAIYLVDVSYLSPTISLFFSAP